MGLGCHPDPREPAPRQGSRRDSEPRSGLQASWLPSSALSLGIQATLSGVRRVSGTEARLVPSGKAAPTSIHNQTGSSQELRPKRQWELRSYLVTDSPAPTSSARGPPPSAPYLQGLQPPLIQQEWNP